MASIWGKTILATLILYVRSNSHVLQWSANSFDTVF